MTRAQERARARRRWEKRQTALAAKEQRRQQLKKQSVVAAGVAAVLVVGGVVALSTLGKDSPTRAGGTASATATGLTAAGCAQPPKPLGTTAKGLKLPDKQTAAGKTFTATLATNCGDIVVSLDGAKAPQTVASFNQLAKVGYWVDSPCHRLTTSGIYVLQCGDPTGTGSGTPGYGFGVENAPASGLYPRGTLAMARTQDAQKGNGGQFFIVYKDTTLPGGYSIFGTVTSGMDIVDKIAAKGSSPQGDGAPVAPISILSVSVTEKKG